MFNFPRNSYHTHMIYLLHGGLSPAKEDRAVNKRGQQCEHQHKVPSIEQISFSEFSQEKKGESGWNLSPISAAMPASLNN